MRMECHMINEISGSKAFTKRECRLGFVHGLNAHKETRHNT